MFIGCAAQIGNAVFRYHDVAQMPRDGLVRVLPDDVGAHLAAALARDVEGDDRAAFPKCVRLLDEFELPADAAHGLAGTGSVRDDATERRDCHRRIDEAGMAASGALAGFIAIKPIGERDRHHRDAGALARRHLPQPGVEVATFDEIPGMDRGPVHLALDDAGINQVLDTVDQHLGHHVEAIAERPLLGRRDGLGKQAFRQHPRGHLGALVARDQRRGDGVADRADPDLKRTAVTDQPRHMQANGVIGQRHRPFDRRKELELRFGIVEQQIDLGCLDLAAVGHEGEFGVHLGGPDEIDLAPLARPHQIDGDVGAARGAVAPIHPRAQQAAPPGWAAARSCSAGS